MLREALIAYFAFSISSSGVEQKFSKGALRFTDRQASAKAETEEMYLKVCLDFQEGTLMPFAPKRSRCGSTVSRRAYLGS